MYHPTTRLLTVLELLQTHEQLSSSELAARLEVAPRTVRRYILMLQDLGIPIEAEMGRSGGYSLRPGFRLPPMMFTNDEALALIVGLMAAQHLGLSSAAHAIEGAKAKLQRVLPEVVRGQTQGIESSLMFDFSAPAQQIESAVLTILGQAAHAEQQVRLIYRTEASETERVVDPYGVVYHDGWYLVGYCHLRTAIRVFRLDRIVAVRRVPGTFVRPSDFNSLDYLIHSFAVIPDRWDVEVILKVSVDAARSVIAAGLGLLEAHPEGTRFTTGITDLDWMARYLVSLGWPLIVCQPAELRQAFAKLADEIAAFARLPQEQAVP